MFDQTAIYIRARKMAAIKEEIAWLTVFLKDRDLKRDIIKLIQVEQLEKKGVDEDDEIIGFYSMLTERISKGRKKFNTPYTMNDTGEFFKSMYVQVLRDSFVIEADGKKGDTDLFEKYGEGIIGLTAENLEIVRERIKNGYIEYLLSID